MSPEPKTIVVTGGAGFVGSRLCARLAPRGHKVISVDNYFTGVRGVEVAGVDYREAHTKDIGAAVPERPTSSSTSASTRASRRAWPSRTWSGT